MSNNVKRRPRRKIRWQMLIVYALALLIPLIILGIILLSYAQNTLSAHYLEVLEADNLRVRTFLTEITDRAYDISNEICFDSSVKQVLTKEHETSQDYVAAVNAVEMLDEIKYGADEIEGLYIYTDNPTVKNYKQFRTVTEEIADADWYRKALNDAAAFWASVTIENSAAQMDNLCIVRRMVLPGSAYQAVVVVRLSDAYLRTRITSGTVVDAISLGDGCVIYASSADMYFSSEPVEPDREDPYYRFSGTAQMKNSEFFACVGTVHPNMTNSCLYVCTLDSSGFAVIDRVMQTGIFILVFALLVPGVILVLFADWFARRVNLLRMEMHKARTQDYNMLDSLSGDDELSETFEDLKFMVQDIKAKDAKMFEAELNEKELRNTQQQMEYKMLTHQINPHYLYNTLETIRMKALTSGNRDVAGAIKILGKTLHHVLENTGATVTTLHKELEHVKNYLAIQQLRFGDRINYSISISPELDPKGYTILPLLLQPVVENAVIHGLETVSGAGQIRIEVVPNGAGELCICIQDNGSGIEPAEMDRIHTMLEDTENAPSSGIALYNIHRRIRLFYGEKYGLRLESELGAGTRVILCLPEEFSQN